MVMINEYTDNIHSDLLSFPFAYHYNTIFPHIQAEHYGK